MPKIHDTIAEVTARIEARSRDSRAAYLDLIRHRKPEGFARNKLTEGNLAHASAGCAVLDKTQILGSGWPNVGIVTSYNDMLSAHAPFENYPEIIRDEARKNTATAQVAGGVPAMCDG
ncbi:MAG: phosphogluconate dehydratase, partial [Pseudomonadota bacterium]